MLKEQSYYSQLLKRFIANELSHEQVEELMNFIEREPQSYDRLINTTEIQAQLKEAAYDKRTDIPESASNRMRDRLMSAVAEPETNHTIAPVHNIHRRGWLRYAAAAVIILGIGAYLWTQKEKSLTKPLRPSVPMTNDVAPGGNKAMLTMSDGRTIVLDNASNGILAKEGQSNVVKKDGEIIYDSESGSIPSSEQSNIPPSERGSIPSSGGVGVGSNTMTTPRGGQYKLTLADGTKVWLNAASSITYPTAFTGKERRVSITGEAYFEVAKNKTKRFIVSVDKKNSPVSGLPSSDSRLPSPDSRLRSPDTAGNLEITVLGTHFNINAYNDEENIKTTLLEGSVKLSLRPFAPSREMTLKPNEQGIATTEKISINKHADAQAAIAWKEGKFQFGEGTDLKAVMRQVSRWYDVEIKYESELNTQIGGSISRQVNVSKVLDLLQSTGVVQFKVEGKQVTVLPMK